MEEVDMTFLDEDRAKAIAEARALVDAKPLYIDTETTGLGNDAEICDIAVVDWDGTVILNTMVKPKQLIPQEAISKHGITNEMVASAPAMPVVYPLLAALFSGRTVVTYNADYDRRLIIQSCAAWGIEPDHDQVYRCAMLLYAQFYGDWNDYFQSYRWKRLSVAAKSAGYPDWVEHRALGDTLATRAVLEYMAAQK